MYSYKGSPCRTPKSPLKPRVRSSLSCSDRHNSLRTGENNLLGNRERKPSPCRSILAETIKEEEIICKTKVDDKLLPSGGINKHVSMNNSNLVIHSENTSHTMTAPPKPYSPAMLKKYRLSNEQLPGQLSQSQRLKILMQNDNLNKLSRSNSTAKIYSADSLSYSARKFSHEAIRERRRKENEQNLRKKDMDWEKRTLSKIKLMSNAEKNISNILDNEKILENLRGHFLRFYISVAALGLS